MLDVFEFLQPPAKLQPFIKYLWVIEGKASEQEPYEHRALVDGCAQLLLAFRGGFYHPGDIGEQSPILKTALVAQTTSPRIYRMKEDFGLFGVCLYPFSIPYLMGIDGRDFIDRLYAPGELIDELTPERERAIIQCGHQESRQVMISDLFERRIDRFTGSEPAVLPILREMFHAKAPDTLSDLVHPESLSSRQLQRQFKRYSGYTPKQLVRILRMQLTLSETVTDNLSGIATDGHYYDQSHLTNEFQSLAGTTPKPYFTGEQTDLGWRRKGVEVAFFQSTAQGASYAVSPSNKIGNKDDADD